MQSPLGVKGLIVNRPMVEAEQNTREAWVRLYKEWLSLHDPNVFSLLYCYGAGYLHASFYYLNVWKRL